MNPTRDAILQAALEEIRNARGMWTLVAARSCAEAALEAAAKAPGLAEDELLIELLANDFGGNQVQSKLTAVGILQIVDAYKRGAR